MSLCIAGTWQPSSAEWDDVWRICPYATFFHSREWAEIWAAYSRGKIAPDPAGLIFSDGTRIILPFSKQVILKGYASRYLSSPAGTFGGWIGNAHLDASQQALLTKWIGRRYRDLVWRLNPYERVSAPIPRGRITEDETHALDLSIGFEEIYRGWTKGHASAARKARKARNSGVEITIAETLEDWKDYFRVYQVSLDRWGDRATSVYDWTLFEAIFRRTSPFVRLWLATHEGSVIAGALCFYSTSHVVYWHGAALSDHFRVRPVNLLMHEAIRDACVRGFKWFDFNPSGGLEGVKVFKRSFHAVPLSSDVVTTSSMRIRLLSTAARLRRCGTR